MKEHAESQNLSMEIPYRFCSMLWHLAKSMWTSTIITTASTFTVDALMATL